MAEQHRVGDRAEEHRADDRAHDRDESLPPDRRRRDRRHPSRDDRARPEPAPPPERRGRARCRSSPPPARCADRARLLPATPTDDTDRHDEREPAAVASDDATSRTGSTPNASPHAKADPASTAVDRAAASRSRCPPSAASGREPAEQQSAPAHCNSTVAASTSDHEPRRYGRRHRFAGPTPIRSTARMRRTPRRARSHHALAGRLRLVLLGIVARRLLHRQARPLRRRSRRPSVDPAVAVRAGEARQPCRRTPVHRELLILSTSANTTTPGHRGADRAATDQSITIGDVRLPRPGRRPADLRAAAGPCVAGPPRRADQRPVMTHDFFRICRGDRLRNDAGTMIGRGASPRRESRRPARRRASRCTSPQDTRSTARSTTACSPTSTRRISRDHVLDVPPSADDRPRRPDARRQRVLSVSAR